MYKPQKSPAELLRRALRLVVILDFAVAETEGQVIVDHADSLHERVTNHRTHKFEASPLEFFAHSARFVSFGRHVLHLLEGRVDWFSVYELPDEFVEGTEFGLGL